MTEKRIAYLLHRLRDKLKDTFAPSRQYPNPRPLPKPMEDMPKIKQKEEK